MARSTFTHLHVHSEYSLLDGLPKIKNLITAAKELEMTSLALTDHGVMYGAIEFYKQALKQEVKPIIGIETYVVNNDHKVKDATNKENMHLVLLAKNHAGYQNLMKLATIASVEGYYYRPRIDKETLRKYATDLIALTACPKGEIGQLLIRAGYAQAKKAVKWYLEVFGKDNFFLEIQRHQYLDFLESTKDRRIKDDLKKADKMEKTWLEGIVKISREMGIPLVATNDVHYIKETDAFAQDVLVCVSTGKNVTDLDRMRYVDNPTFHLRSEAEMRSIFPDYPDAVDNTAKVADQIDIQIELGKWYFPNMDLPENKTADQVLREEVYSRAPNVYTKIDTALKERIDFELDVIINKGYPAYFLMMADMVNWCTSQGIITTTRGSAAGSVVSYIMGIVSVDPLKYGLPFERFLNPFRPKPPDIDLDIADNRREELIAYTTKKYGKDKVAQICTFGRMLARAAVRDVGRVLGHPYSFPDKIAKLIPLGAQGFPMTVNRALEESPELMALNKSDPKVKEVLEVARQIEGNARHASVHAAGIVISPTDMTDFTPLQLEPKGRKIITQYEMHACEDVGLIKFDFLGLRNLSILGAALQIIKGARKVDIDLKKIPLDDQKTFTMLARGETMGVFQLGGSGMTKWLKELKPNRIEDIMAMIALFRPGPMANIPDYIARKSGKKKVTYLHPKMANYLDKSYGIIVYQEDVLFTALELAGYNWETVDSLRTAIGKKIPELMAEQHEVFVKGCQEHSGISKDKAEKIWDLFVPFQGYGFNKAHATAYGTVSYQTAYLKAHFPVEYMTALLTAESGNTDKITEAIVECNRMGIKILPPDINISKEGFRVEEAPGSLEGRGIRFGLSAIKNVGDTAIRVILEERQKAGLFDTLTEFCQRVDQQKVNKKVLESLIKAGAMDRFGKRAAMLAALDTIRSKGSVEQKRRAGGQIGFFDIQEDDARKIKAADDFPDIEEFNQKEKLSLEKELLGLYLTEHPLDNVLPLLAGNRSHRLSEIGSPESTVKKIKIGGIVTQARVILTRNGHKEMAFATLEDETATREVVVFPDTFAQTKELWTKDSLVFVSGKVEPRDDGVSIIVESAVSIETLTRTSAPAVDDQVDWELAVPSRTSSGKLVRLNELFKNTPGSCRIALSFQHNGGDIKRIVLPYGVALDTDLKEKSARILADD